VAACPAAICGFIDRMANPDADGTGMMRAVVIDRFGGPEQLHERHVPLPSPGRGEVLIRLETAGVGSWDPFEREGGYAEMQGMSPSFPYILGSEGAGRVAAIASGVTNLELGDPCLRCQLLESDGRFLRRVRLRRRQSRRADSGGHEHFAGSGDGRCRHDRPARVAGRARRAER
jgi:NADPH:quinone reductase-like Zn-dependent oxidoreductase